mmetsp:Transcript_20885/g.53921  ORF Transcript_20885/g.53921 Transcript_20885/m.53921 type:complete len:372 (+) Transcript_20885:25-1140(+)
MKGNTLHLLTWPLFVAIFTLQGLNCHTVKTGAEILLERSSADLYGKKVGVISNPTGVLPNLVHTVDALFAKSLQSTSFKLCAIFGPEHGFRGDEQAGKGGTTSIDVRTGLPVFSLYGKNTTEIKMLFLSSGVDLILFDIQDVGTRFYTYIWTMGNAMEAAGSVGIDVWVLDRPNPLTGTVEGPVLDPAFASGVGMYPIPLRHGMTVGELAKLFCSKFISTPPVLKIIRMEGYKRNMSFEDTKLPFVIPSPNIPSVHAAFAYNGFGMLEGTNCSEGRGTTLPFLLVGHPEFDGNLTDSLRIQANRGLLQGAQFREAYFIPTFSKYEGTTVAGVELFLSSDTSPLEVFLAFIIQARSLYGEKVPMLMFTVALV